jgi:DNA-binding CsgD family transcriptional regulator
MSNKLPRLVIHLCAGSEKNAFIQMAEALNCFHSIMIFDDLPHEITTEHTDSVVFTDATNATYWTSVAVDQSIRLGLVLHQLDVSTCTLVGNTKPEFIILGQHMEEDFSYLSRAVKKHRMYFNDLVMRKLLKNANYKPLPEDYRLSDKQILVFRAYVKVGTTAQAAELLGMAESTVKEHLHKIKSRLGMVSQVQVSHLFTVFGWLEPDLLGNYRQCDSSGEIQTDKAP